jgi:dipeptidyl aminopeptidase/acylaminoacyl peptidase
MRRYNRNTLVLLITVVLLLSTGCSKQAEPTTAPNINTTVIPTSTQTKDGAIVSKQLVHVDGQNPNIYIYKIFYISQGVKVEAILTEPKIPSHYPLFVNLHGGYAVANPNMTHSYLAGYTPEMVSHMSDQMITIAPEYRGYYESEGTVQDLLGCTIDTENAIKAAGSVGNVNQDQLYLLGYSLGGGVSLMIASERKDVRAVVAVSPFVGYDEYVKWFSKHPDATTEAERTFKPMVQNWKALMETPDNKQESMMSRIPNIQAPVLLLQGTGDKNVIWQTVSQFADDLKNAHKSVKLVIYPGGQHGLHDQNEAASSSEMRDWFEQTGLDFP